MALTLLRRNQLGNDKNHSFLLISDTNGECKNIPYQSIVSALKNKSIDITNVTLSSQGLLKGSNGDLSRYPLVRYNKLEDIVHNKSYASVIENGYNLIILGQTASGRFKVANLNGMVVECSENDIIKNCSMMNSQISNGSIVEGKFIRAISGNYRIFGDAKIVQKPLVKPIEKPVAKPVQQQQPVKKPIHMSNSYEELKAQVDKNKQEAEKKAEELKVRDQNLRSTYKTDNNSVIEIADKKFEVDESIAEDVRRAQINAIARGEISGKKLPKISKKAGYKEGDFNFLEGDSKIAKTAFHGGNSANNGKISIEAKIILAASTLKSIDPFLYAAYLELKQVLLAEPTEGINTMAVTDDKLYIVQSAIARMELPQIAWILLHEISHVIGRHIIRRGQRDPYLFNVACDLHINKMIADEFGCKPGVPVIKTVYNNIAPIGLEFHMEINDETQDFVMSLYSDDIDSKKETVESIYERLIDENKEKLNKQNQSGQGQNQSGQGQNQSGQGQNQSGQGQNQSGQGQNQSEDDQNSQGQNSGENSQDQSGQGQGQNSSDNSNGQEQGQSGQGQSGQGQNQSGQGQSGQGQSGQEQSGQNQSGQGQSGQGSDDPNDKYITLNGKRIAPLEQNKGHSDLYEDDDTDSHGNTPEGRKEWADSFVKRIVQRSKTFERSGNSPMLRQAEEALLEDFVWTSFVRQFLTKLAGVDYSYTKPNRKGYGKPYFTKGKIKNEELAEESVYVAMDVSGSVTDKDLYKAFEYIRVLLKKFDITGYVLFWSTMVDDPIPFKNSKELVAIRNRKFKSTGGTDPKCVFEFFKSKKCKSKPNLVIVITDGVFDMPPKELKPRCETLWIITDNKHNYREFKPTFGKVAPLIPKI